MGRRPLLGECNLGHLRLSGVGHLVRQEWTAIQEALPTVAVDAFVIMPDHMHAIVWIVELPGPRGSVPSTSLWRVMQRFKSISTRKINQIQGTPGAQFWQRSYHDRIIRDEAALQMMRQYIHDNPARWRRSGPIGWGRSGGRRP